jgi:hypothetical protein
VCAEAIIDLVAGKEGAGSEPDLYLRADDVGSLACSRVHDVAARMKLRVRNKRPEVSTVFILEDDFGLCPDKSRLAALVAADQVASNVINAIAGALSPIKDRSDAE